MVNRWSFTKKGLRKLHQEKADPWHLGSSRYEQDKFDKLVEVAQGAPHASILEVGCGGGHLTEKLCTISNEVSGFDLSSDAIERARIRAPLADLFVRDSDEFDYAAHRVDLIVASEVLYYIDQKQQTLNRMAGCSDYLLTCEAWFLGATLPRRMEPWKLVKSVSFSRFKQLRWCSIRLWQRNGVTPAFAT